MFLCRLSYVLDNEAPKLYNLPNSISVYSNSGKAFAIVNWSEPNATDKSDKVTVSSRIKPGSQFYLGTTTVTYTAVEPSGNSNCYTFAVTVTDQYVDLTWVYVTTKV